MNYSGKSQDQRKQEKTCGRRNLLLLMIIDKVTINGTESRDPMEHSKVILSAGEYEIIAAE